MRRVHGFDRRQADVIRARSLPHGWTGRENITVEGLSKNGKLDPLQVAFIEHDAPQCGFCTSGQLMSAKALLNTNPHPTRDEVRHAMAGQHLPLFRITTITWKR